jgi:hypothetical protein
MALRVDSSNIAFGVAAVALFGVGVGVAQFPASKAVFGVAAVAVLGVSTVLYLRSRGNVSAPPTAPSLDNGRFAFLANIPLIRSVYNHFNPEPPLVVLGNSNHRIGSNELAIKLQGVKAQHPALDTLIIYGNFFEITQDPGILALNPMKLILVGARIVEDHSSSDSLYHQMITRGWNIDLSTGQPLLCLEFATIQDALDAKLEINPVTGQPFPQLYFVRA